MQEPQETWVQSLGQEDSPGGGNGNPLKYSCLENSIDRGAWCAIAHGVTKSQTRLSDQHFHLQYYKIKYLRKKRYDVCNLFPNKRRGQEV